MHVTCIYLKNPNLKRKEKLPQTEWIENGAIKRPTKSLLASVDKICSPWKVLHTRPRISPRGFSLVLTWMKAVPWCRCCSNSRPMSFNTPWAWRRGGQEKKNNVTMSLWLIWNDLCICVHVVALIGVCVHTDVPVIHRSRSAASCARCCCRLALRSQPARGGGRSQWDRQFCWGLQQQSRNAGGNVCPLTPRHDQKHRFLLVETQSGLPEGWATLEGEEIRVS